MMIHATLLMAGLAAQSASVATTHVRIDFFEGLAPKDTTSSERFQKEYESAISTAKALLQRRLADCGYTLETKSIFFNATDGLEAMERAKSSESEGAWLLVGPRRSNHYLLLAKGAGSTPTLSTMASSQEVFELGRLHRTMAPSNAQMAKIAAREAKSRSQKGATYLSVVSQDCVACLDFAVSFDEAAKAQGLRNLKSFPIMGETPDLSAIAEEVSRLKPSFILLPNYSKVTVQAIARLRASAPKAFFVGGDGWGDARFGFVQDGANLEGARGFTVRGFPPPESGLRNFKLGRELLSSRSGSAPMPESAVALSVLKLLEDTSDLLCSSRPKSKDAFRKAFESAKSKRFSAPFGVSIYELQGSAITFGKTVTK
jgi:hypothetical protein